MHVVCSSAFVISVQRVVWSHLWHSGQLCQSSTTMILCLKGKEVVPLLVYFIATKLQEGIADVN